MLIPQGINLESTVYDFLYVKISKHLYKLYGNYLEIYINLVKFNNSKR